MRETQPAFQWLKRLAGSHSRFESGQRLSSTVVFTACSSGVESIRLISERSLVQFQPRGLSIINEDFMKCQHHTATPSRKEVRPPTNCGPFYVQSMRCNECGAIFSTGKQRTKNRKSFNQAYKKYHNKMIETHGIYY